MKLNTRIRSRLARYLDEGEDIVATILLNYMVGTASASSDGTSKQSSSILGSAYAERLGVDFSDPTLRADLLSSWCTLTDRRLLFHGLKKMAVRPTPADLIDALPREGVVLRWFDVDGLALSNRAIHLEFPDGRRLLSATMLKATVRRKPFNDEPELFVSAFGDQGQRVEDR